MTDTEPQLSTGSNEPPAQPTGTTDAGEAPTEQTDASSQNDWSSRITHAIEKLGIPMPESALNAILSNPVEAEKFHGDLSARISAGEHKPAGELKVESKPDKPIFHDTGEFDAQAWADRAGLDFDDLAQRAMGDKGLDDETYKKLAKASGRSVGEAKAIIKGRIADEKLKAIESQQARDDAVSVIGGYERWENELQPWLQQHVVDEKFSQAEIDDLNRRLGDPKLARSTLRDIEARYKVANPEGRTPIAGTPASGGALAPETPKELNELRSKAENGDEAAIAAINILTGDQIKMIYRKRN